MMPGPATWGRILALVLTGCVTLGNFSKALPFPRVLEVQTIVLTTAELLNGLNEQICVKLVEKGLAKSTCYLWVSL